MTSEEQKRLWKEESEQLDKDLASRKKVVKRNTVEIKFGGKSSSNSKKSTLDSKRLSGSSSTDSFFRSRIKFVEPISPELDSEA